MLTETWDSIGVVSAGFYFALLFTVLFLNPTASARKSIKCMERVFPDLLRFDPSRNVPGFDCLVGVTVLAFGYFWSERLLIDEK